MVNSSHINSNKASKPYQASLKTIKRLEPISSLLALLPNLLVTPTSDFVSVLLSKPIEVLHSAWRYKHRVYSPDFIPHTIKIKFKLTCKAEYEGSTLFKSHAKQAAKIIKETKQSLRGCMVSVMNMELECEILNLQKGFISELLKLLSYWVCYCRAIDPDNQPPFSNNKGAEELLHVFFNQQNQNYSNFFMLIKFPSYLNISHLVLK